jgi:hypothetical protein
MPDFCTDPAPRVDRGDRACDADACATPSFRVRIAAAPGWIELAGSVNTTTEQAVDFGHLRQDVAHECKTIQ